MTKRSVLLAAAALAIAGVAYAQEPQRRVVRVGPGMEGPPQPALPDTPENRRLILGRLADALEHAQAMLHPSLQPLPSELEAALERAIASGEPDDLRSAIEFARPLGYA